MAKFDKTFCSQCGREFGPGDHGFSHCDSHVLAHDKVTITVNAGRDDEFKEMVRIYANGRFEIRDTKTCQDCDGSGEARIHGLPGKFQCHPCNGTGKVFIWRKPWIAHSPLAAYPDGDDSHVAEVVAEYIDSLGKCES